MNQELSNVKNAFHLKAQQTNDKRMSNHITFLLGNGSYKFVLIEDIVFCKTVEQGKTFVDLGVNKHFTAMKNLGYYEKELSNQSNFFRIHDNLLLNLNYLDEYNHTYGYVFLKDGRRQPVQASRQKGKELKEILMPDSKILKDVKQLTTHK